MKKIELLIENFWEAPRFFAGVRLRVRLYYLKKLNFFSRMAPLFYCGWLIKTKINEAINYFRDEASGYL